MSIENYISAQREGVREARALRAAGKDPYLPVLADLLPEYGRLSHARLGIIQIPVSDIVGTATRGRTSAFASGFLPLLEPGTEFSSKWANLYVSALEEGIREPIIAYEYYHQYYVVEGNKRVSVARRIDAPYLEADVTRILPEPEDSERYRVYKEYLSFYGDTKLSALYFSREGGFSRLSAMAGRIPGTPWPAEAVFDLSSCFYRFCQAYGEVFGRNPPMWASDAMLIYLEIYGYAECVGKTPSEMRRELERIRPEFLVAAAGKPAVLLSKASEEKPGLLQAVLRRQPAVLRCGFLYSSAPDRSGWTYWHELGREALQDAFGTRVESVYKSNVEPEQAAAVIEEMIADKCTVIFATSPVFLDACIRESALHPESKILNCSLLASYHNVRSYYLRIYEAKFVLGMIAGAMAENDLIGYIADYPIYGTPASVNAFSLGAQATNPRAAVLLDWSTLPDHDPEEALSERGVRVFSGRDIRAPILESRAFGLYDRAPDGRIQNLAMPVWNWKRLYESILRSVITGAYAEEGEKNADRAMNYYMGMSTGAIDLVYSEKLPDGIRRLAELAQGQIRKGDFHPFSGPLSDRDGLPRCEKGAALGRPEIIGMDWLLPNVAGEIPTLPELTPAARRLVALQGIRATRPAYAGIRFQSGSGGKEARREDPDPGRRTRPRPVGAPRPEEARGRRSHPLLRRSPGRLPFLPHLLHGRAHPVRPRQSRREIRKRAPGGLHLHRRQDLHP